MPKGPTKSDLEASLREVEAELELEKEARRLAEAVRDAREREIHEIEAAAAVVSERCEQLEAQNELLRGLLREQMSQPSMTFHVEGNVSVDK